MWLVNTDSLALKEVSEPSSIKYAILSHTWEDDEVTFQDFQDVEQTGARYKSGFSKIEKTCELARQRGLQYAWVDTCCIDKSSSAELSEAINSMFSWYRESTVCFVFLSDLPASERLIEQVDLSSIFPYAQKTFAACRWFTRGWTLQELIAPSEVEFFDSQWGWFSRKADCLDKLEEITGIRRSVLESSSNLRQTPIAVKMSWAASRKTKRVEDRAYSLLGIFNINMSMIYGEGSKAFRRLQEEISRETNDLSLFAWRGPAQEDAGYQRFRGIFARSPSEFSTCSTLQRSGTKQDSQSEFTLTNKGVRFETKLYKHAQGAYVMYLGFNMRENTPVCIILTRTAEGFIRSEPWSLIYEHSWSLSRIHNTFTIHVQKDVSVHEDALFYRQRHRSFHININLQTSLKLEQLESYPEYPWDEVHSNFISSNPEESYAARLKFLIRDTDSNFDETFPLTLTLGWASSHQQPFAVLYGSEGLVNTAKLAIRNILPDSFPDLVKDDLYWGSSYEESFEKALSRIYTNPQFQATELSSLHSGSS
ncbi:heterokaryon incompatibility protein-domain-containing protein [Colletotrichum phormii]|uniref:Heterokaryon incompatibility protein-domain-containing protein n=1 Tax=Colletotrichum phormii TaxID=359342 RepID=A0AAJ0A351_9PEZI|nr:heterokaryon incompatibility protein-domain-containing protein [Colletotrichum phormii]KAK1655587.1 heterokaryon incompatibility protein-domain-containing protein [Colletotrichum phormii]